MQALLYCDLVKGIVSERPGGAAFVWPKLVQGDDLQIGLRLTTRVDEASLEVQRSIQSLRVSLGRDDARPESGAFKLKVGSSSPVAGVNVTPSLAWNASSDQVAAAINALSGLTNEEKNATVSQVDGSWRLKLKDGSQKAISLAESSLFPVSFLRVRTLLENGRTTHDLRLSQSPVAFTEGFDTVIPEPPAISSLREGGSSGSSEWNEVQKLTVPPDFRGTYQLARGFKKTPLLSIEDGAEEIAEALKSIADEEGVFLVTNPTGNAAHIEFSGSMGGSNHDLLTVSVFDAPPGDPRFTLSLNTHELAVLLNRKASEKLILEARAELADPQDEEITRQVTLFRAEVEAVREIGWEGLAEAQSIDWLRPPLPDDYVPFTEDQIAVGFMHYGPVLLGDGAADSFVVDHNLDSDAVNVVIRQNSTPGALLVPGSDYLVQITNANSIIVTMLGSYADPVPTLNALAITVQVWAEASHFEDHTHAIAQIVGLQAILDGHGADIAELQSLLGIGSITADVAGLTAPVVSWALVLC